MSNRIEEQIATLPSLSKAALSDLWRHLFKTAPLRKMPKALVIRLLAYQIQEQAYGCLGARHRQRLRQLVRAFEANPNAGIPAVAGIKPGTRRVRRWRDQIQVVNVEEKGYEYKGGAVTGAFSSLA